MELRFRRLDPEAVLPSRAHPRDAGLDLSSAIDIHIGPGPRDNIPTGPAGAIRDGFAGLAPPRSGLASRHGLTLSNAPGLIDAGYRGEIICAVVNLDRAEAVSVAKGERIAQLVIVEAPEFQPVWSDELPDSTRG